MSSSPFLQPFKLGDRQLLKKSKYIEFRREVQIAFPSLRHYELDRLLPRKEPVHQDTLSNDVLVYSYNQNEPLFFKMKLPAPLPHIMNKLKAPTAPTKKGAQQQPPPGKGDNTTVMTLVPTIFALWRFPTLLPPIYTQSVLFQKLTGVKATNLYLPGVTMFDLPDQFYIQAITHPTSLSKLLPNALINSTKCIDLDPHLNQYRPVPLAPENDDDDDDEEEDDDSDDDDDEDNTRRSKKTQSSKTSSSSSLPAGPDFSKVLPPYITQVTFDLLLRPGQLRAIYSFGNPYAIGITQIPWDYVPETPFKLTNNIMDAYVSNKPSSPSSDYLTPWPIADALSNNTLSLQVNNKSITGIDPQLTSWPRTINAYTQHISNDNDNNKIKTFPIANHKMSPLIDIMSILLSLADGNIPSQFNNNSNSSNNNTKKQQQQLQQMIKGDDNDSTEQQQQLDGKNTMTASMLRIILSNLNTNQTLFSTSVPSIGYNATHKHSPSLSYILSSRSVLDTRPMGSGYTLPILHSLHDTLSQVGIQKYPTDGFSILSSKQLIAKEHSECMMWYKTILLFLRVSWLSIICRPQLSYIVPLQNALIPGASSNNGDNDDDDDDDDDEDYDDDDNQDDTETAAQILRTMKGNSTASNPEITTTTTQSSDPINPDQPCDGDDEDAEACDDNDNDDDDQPKICIPCANARFEWALQYVINECINSFPSPVSTITPLLRYCEAAPNCRKYIHTVPYHDYKDTKKITCLCTECSSKKHTSHSAIIQNCICMNVQYTGMKLNGKYTTYSKLSTLIKYAENHDWIKTKTNKGSVMLSGKGVINAKIQQQDIDLIAQYKEQLDKERTSANNNSDGTSDNEQGYGALYDSIRLVQYKPVLGSFLLQHCGTSFSLFSLLFNTKLQKTGFATSLQKESVVPFTIDDFIGVYQQMLLKLNCAELWRITHAITTYAQDKNLQLAVADGCIVRYSGHIDDIPKQLSSLPVTARGAKGTHHQQQQSKLGGGNKSKNNDNGFPSLSGGLSSSSSKQCDFPSSDDDDDYDHNDRASTLSSKGKGGNKSSSSSSNTDWAGAVGNGTNNKQNSKKSEPQQHQQNSASKTAQSSRGDWSDMDDDYDSYTARMNASRHHDDSDSDSDLDTHSGNTKKTKKTYGSRQFAQNQQQQQQSTPAYGGKGQQQGGKNQGGNKQQPQQQQQQGQNKQQKSNNNDTQQKGGSGSNNDNKGTNNKGTNNKGTHNNNNNKSNQPNIKSGVYLAYDNALYTALGLNKDTLYEYSSLPALVENAGKQVASSAGNILLDTAHLSALQEYWNVVSTNTAIDLAINTQQQSGKSKTAQQPAYQSKMNPSKQIQLLLNTFRDRYLSNASTAQASMKVLTTSQLSMSSGASSPMIYIAKVRILGKLVTLVCGFELFGMDAHQVVDISVSSSTGGGPSINMRQFMACSISVMNMEEHKKVRQLISAKIPAKCIDMLHLQGDQYDRLVLFLTQYLKIDKKSIQKVGK